MESHWSGPGLVADAHQTRPRREPNCAAKVYPPLFHNCSARIEDLHGNHALPLLIRLEAIPALWDDRGSHAALPLPTVDEAEFFPSRSWAIVPKRINQRATTCCGRRPHHR